MYHRREKLFPIKRIIDRMVLPARQFCFRRYFLLACCFPLTVLADSSDSVESQTNNSGGNQVTQHKQLDRGQRVYQRFCSLCHGTNLQGQPNWRKRKPDGKLPAPPHNGEGHTWHHPDNFLFGITKYGLVPPYAPPGYQSDMPAWKDTLSDNDIWAVITYIKSRWPKDKLQYQQQITAQSH